MRWIKKVPTIAGNYWFYGERFSVMPNEIPNKPELIFCEVLQCSNGTILTGGGQIINTNDFGRNWAFSKAILPETPIFPTTTIPFRQILSYVEEVLSCNCMTYTAYVKESDTGHCCKCRIHKAIGRLILKTDSDIDIWHNELKKRLEQST